ncbi:MAG: hypothetical protein QXR30_03365 [Candidatus Woesearchaeota archaeon]
MIVPKNNEDLLKKYNFKEVEKDPVNGIVTGYPKPLKYFKIIYSSPKATLENHYYFFVNFLERIKRFEEFEKITDVYSSSTMSGFFGNAMQRLANQQDRISGILAAIGKLSIDILKQVQELRKIDERLGYFKAWKEKSQAADVALKGIWADNVDNASKTEMGLFVLAQQAGYSALPDLFFRTFVQDEKEIDSIVDAYDVSLPLKSVLKRKLMSFLRWAKEIEHELSVRRNVLLKMMVQNYNSLKMYSHWLKPYLTNVRYLNLHEKYMNSVYIVNSFDANVTEIEFLAKRKNSGDSSKYDCVLVNMFFRTAPLMMTGQEYQRYPIHLGTLEITLRGYVWSKEEIENYKKMREEEGLSLIADIDNSIRETLKNLGDDFEKYLKEAEGVKKEETKKEEKKESSAKNDSFGDIFEPLKALAEGLIELFTLFLPEPSEEKKSESKKEVDKKKIVSDLTDIYIKYKKWNRWWTFDV